MSTNHWDVGLEPLDLAAHLQKLELQLGQVCQIAGISKMQLDYWTTKARIPTKGRKQRIYDVDALETVMLIKQAKNKARNLGAAIGAAKASKGRKSLTYHRAACSASASPRARPARP